MKRIRGELITEDLKAGDVLVPRGTIHNWVNRATQPYVMAFIVIDAKPVEAGGKLLNAVEALALSITIPIRTESPTGC